MPTCDALRTMWHAEGLDSVYVRREAWAPASCCMQCTNLTGSTGGHLHFIAVQLAPIKRALWQACCSLFVCLCSFYPRCLHLKMVLYQLSPLIWHKMPLQ